MILFLTLMMVVNSLFALRDAGLFPAAAYQFCMNGMRCIIIFFLGLHMLIPIYSIRLGSYSVIKQLLHLDHTSGTKDTWFLLKNMLAGSSTSSSSSPYQLIHPSSLLSRDPSQQAPRPACWALWPARLSSW